MIFIHFLKGYVQVAFTGDDIPRLIRICISRGIFLWNIKSKDPEYMTACMYGADVFALYDILHKTGTRLRIQKKCGLPFFCRRHRNRIGFVAGIPIMLMLLFYLSGFIWMIRIEGNSYLTEELLTSYLGEIDQGIGCRKDQLDTEELEKRMLEEFPEIIWISVSYRGSTLSISLREKMVKDEGEITAGEEGMDLIAPCDGTVERLFVREGTAAVMEGDTVKKGDVLLYGWIPITNDSGDTILSYRSISADGDVWIRGTKQFTFQEPLAYEKKVFVGEEREYLDLSFYGTDFNVIPLLYGKNSHTTMTQVKQLHFGGVLSLPIYCNELTEKTYILQNSVHTKEEMQQIMQNKEQSLLKKLEEKGVQIIDKNVIIKYNRKWCKMQEEITCRYPASQKRTGSLPEISNLRESDE